MEEGRKCGNTAWGREHDCFGGEGATIAEEGERQINLGAQGEKQVPIANGLESESAQIL